MQYQAKHGFSCDLDLDPKIFIYELNQKIMKMYLHTKAYNRHTDTQTDATENITTPHSLLVINTLITSDSITEAGETHYSTTYAGPL